MNLKTGYSRLETLFKIRFLENSCEEIKLLQKENDVINELSIS